MIQTNKKQPFIQAIKTILEKIANYIERNVCISFKATEQNFVEDFKPVWAP